MFSKSVVRVIYGIIFVVALVLVYFSWSSLRRTTVVVEWSTASELDTVGFNVYRSQQVDGNYQRINENLIAAQGDSLAGGSYRYVDKDVSPGQAYYYRLEDVNSDGQGSFSDPTQVTAQRGGFLEMIASIVLAGVGLVGLLLSSLPSRKSIQPVKGQE
jgi:hypothetical protein